MEELNLELNHTYLIRYGNTDIISSITVLLITDKAYHLRWNRGLEGNDTWELKEKISHDYSIVEDISDFVTEKPAENYKFDITYNTIPEYYFSVTEICSNCGGSGQIQDFQSTAGTKLCPICNGSGRVTKDVNVFRK